MAGVLALSLLSQRVPARARLVEGGARGRGGPLSHNSRLPWSSAFWVTGPGFPAISTAHPYYPGHAVVVHGYVAPYFYTPYLSGPWFGLQWGYPYPYPPYPGPY